MDKNYQLKPRGVSGIIGKDGGTNMDTKTILIVEDDRALNDGIRLSMKDLGILQAFSLQEARELIKRRPDLIILDINLPDGSGLDFFMEIKSAYHIPVIFLTANDMESDVVTGLELGADDYITKPFSLAILRARVHAVMRRNTERVKKIGGLTLDFDQMRFAKEGEEFELSKTEQKLLRLLVEHPNTTLTRDFLIDRVWSDGAEFVNENALSVTIKRLRTKIEDDPKNPRYIKTVFGIGYQWGI